MAVKGRNVSLYLSTEDIGYLLTKGTSRGEYISGLIKRDRELFPSLEAEGKAMLSCRIDVVRDLVSECQEILKGIS